MAAALLLSAATMSIASHRATADDSVDGVQTSLAPAESGLDLALGRALFERAWVSAPASTKSTDGLGPLYNARSCASCHTGARRQPEDESGQAISSAIIFKLAGASALDSTYGAQLQTAAVHGLPAEGRALITYQEIPVALADGRVVRLQRPSYRITDLGYGPLDPATVLSPRVPPSLAGVGLLERIDAASILAWADREKGNGISGQPSRPAECAGRRGCIGRFGWKAGTATIEAQNALAFSLDIGMVSCRTSMRATSAAISASARSRSGKPCLLAGSTSFRRNRLPPAGTRKRSMSMRLGDFLGMGAALLLQPRKLVRRIEASQTATPG